MRTTISKILTGSLVAGAALAVAQQRREYCSYCDADEALLGEVCAKCGNHTAKPQANLWHPKNTI